MKDDFVPFELAKKMRKEGFLYDTYLIYFEDGSLGVYTGIEDIIRSSVIPRPTIALAMKWLREEKKIYVQIEIHGKGYVCALYGRKYDDSYLIREFHSNFNTYEEAALTGIEYILEYLI